MFSDKIYKHFFSELSKHFFIVLFDLSAVVWAVQSVNFLDLIVEDGHSVALYIKYSSLNVVKILIRLSASHLAAPLVLKTAPRLIAPAYKTITPQLTFFS